MSRRVSLISVVALLFAIQAAAGTLQYGKEEELHGVTKIFIDTDGDLELHNNIVKEMLDDLPEPSPLTIVDTPEDAELIIVVSSVITSRGNPYTELKAAKVVQDQQTLRILWQWGDENTFRFGRRPSSRAADRFVAVWKKYNPELVPSVKK